jgi:23S rRNA-/tRNA-specific pseudouridylate synthase
MSYYLVQITSSLYYDSLANKSRVATETIDGTLSITVVTHISTLSDRTHLVCCQPVTGHR